MSEIGSNTFQNTSRVRMSGPYQHRESRDPVRIKCTNCSNRVLAVVDVKQLFAYRKGDPRIAQTGYDREISTEHWCLDCLRSAFIEDDRNRTKVSVAI